MQFHFSDQKRYFSRINNRIYFHTRSRQTIFPASLFLELLPFESKGSRFLSDVRECSTVPQERAKHGWEGDRYKWNTRNSGAINAANDKSLAIL